MAIARMRVTPELLIDMMRLPVETQILGVRMEYAGFSHVLVFTVNHPDINTDDVLPQYQSHYDEQGNFTKVEFVAWNTPAMV